MITLCIHAISQATLKYVPKIVTKNWGKFGLQKEILLSLASLGFNNPTPIQSHCIPLATKSSKDIFGAAETGSEKTRFHYMSCIINWLNYLIAINGSGKTLAYSLPIISKILLEIQKEETGKKNSNLSSVKALIIAPTRELVLQVCKHIKNIILQMPLRVVPVVGGMSSQKQERLLLRSGSHNILIATPGRLWQFIEEKSVECINNLPNSLQFLVIDEADRMIEFGHFAELKEILDFINPDKEFHSMQTFVFSATLSLTHSLPKRLGKKRKKNTREKLLDLAKTFSVHIKSAEIVDLSSKEITCSNLIEKKIICFDSLDKDIFLFDFISSMQSGRALIFANSIDHVKKICFFLRLVNCSSLALHSHMQQKQRIKFLERFTDNDKSVLVATDVASRGLDISGVSHVIHYHVPRTSESYVHRSGRTARIGKCGSSFILVEPKEDLLWNNIIKNLHKENIAFQNMQKGEQYDRFKEIVKCACELRDISHRYERKLVKTNTEKKIKKCLSEETDSSDVESQCESNTVMSEEQDGMKSSIKYLQKCLNELLKAKSVKKLNMSTEDKISILKFSKSNCNKKRKA